MWDRKRGYRYDETKNCAEKDQNLNKELKKV